MRLTNAYDPMESLNLLTTYSRPIHPKPPKQGSKVGGICRLRGRNHAVLCRRREERQWLDRRELLLASTSAIAAGVAKKAAAKPVPPPDLERCHNPDTPKDAQNLNCCPPYSEKPVDFELPTNLPMRVRRSAHEVSGKYVETYSRAVQLMRELPEDDPRSFKQQANVHCAYCDGAYYQGSLPIELQIHNSWYFLPWHRWYLYFHERILAKLVGDDTFALPFWNWDSPAGMTFPPIYAHPDSPLYDDLRNHGHMHAKIDLNYNPDKPSSRTTLSAPLLLASNTNLLYRQIVSGAKTPALFQGQPYRFGDDTDPGAGTLENAPHGPVHVWTGSPDQPNLEDMGNFYSSARDPIFFAHHANVDRMWTIWKSLEGKRRVDFDDPDYLQAQFLFYDENARLVRVKVADALDPQNLMFSYQRVDMPWVKARPKKSTGKIQVASAGSQAAIAAGHVAEFGSKARKLVAPITVLVKKPKKKRSKKEIEDETEEVLVIGGIVVKRGVAAKFDVFINLAEADSDTDISCPEYAGTFSNVPHHHEHGHGHDKNKRDDKPKSPYRKSSFKVGITEILEDLGATEDDDIVVTLVPKGHFKANPIEISSIKIEYD